MPHQVFISHVAEDADVALEIAQGLEAKGYGTWYYERDSIPGLAYLIQVGQAIEQSQAVLVVISAASLGSNQVTVEVVRAHESSKHFVPVLRDITHQEFQTRQPEWRTAMGAATSITIPPQGAAAILPRLVAGLTGLGIQPTAEEARGPEAEAAVSAPHQIESTDAEAPRGTSRAAADEELSAVLADIERGFGDAVTETLEGLAETRGQDTDLQDRRDRSDH